MSVKLFGREFISSFHVWFHVMSSFILKIMQASRDLIVGIVIAEYGMVWMELVLYLIPLERLYNNICFINYDRNSYRTFTHGQISLVSDVEYPVDQNSVLYTEQI